MTQAERQQEALGDGDLLAQTDVWAVRTLEAVLKSPQFYVPAGMEYEDLLAIARTAAWKATQTYDGERGAELRSWVIGQVRHAVREACRSRNYGGARASIVNRLEFVSFEAMSVPDEAPIEPVDPRNVYEAADARLMTEYLARIWPARTLMIFREYFGFDRTAREVGAACGISDNRVNQIIAEGRAKAREALAR